MHPPPGCPGDQAGNPSYILHTSAAPRAESWELGTGDMNKIFPQVEANGKAAARTNVLPGEEAAQACVTVTNRTGFLCRDRRSCISASGVCDGVRTCPHGEDEDEDLCRDVPKSLPQFLVAHCGDPASWIYSDQRCDGTNNCGDCSDELIPVTVCPPCGPGWWRCTSTVFKYCGCIPRSLCRDRVQHCSDWSDEYSCPGP
ncbi:low-density lipoprotein receptor class A domain-containing protein 1 isoform X3 [Phyllostomus discolor]|uniref:Low-density lipoprotein receptor class A domain-containing protein 1 isoform X3 n=2 Tax=Phyllostomus discolor TaxID=89673 RepID=A0A7E6DTA0_9CHIR|nr:low-density lipoprotein receptor class A domain-containing protein 1 isoform X3 [Phyllostomus discolor]